MARASAVTYARTQAQTTTQGSRRRRSKGPDCTPCAAKKTAAAMWNRNDKLMGLDKNWK